mgnify:CR=1 FL=1
MDNATLITTYLALLVAALAGSLHCIGMCGPILVAFSGAMKSPVSQDVAAPAPSVAWSFLWYHAGRIWTYAALGLLAGYVGGCLRHGSSLVGWQRAIGFTAAALTIFLGLALFGIIPSLRLDKSGACGIKKIWTMPLLRSLLRHNSAASRLLLGAIMGLLPCGLVYGMLAIVATMPTPWHAALGMSIFGIGTIPSLTAVLVTTHLVPARWRGAGTRVAAIMVILTGVWMAVRTIIDLCGNHVA